MGAAAWGSPCFQALRAPALFLGVPLESLTVYRTVPHPAIRSSLHNYYAQQVCPHCPRALESPSMFQTLLGDPGRPSPLGSNHTTPHSTAVPCLLYYMAFPSRPWQRSLGPHYAHQGTWG